jgi:2-polyprenyl-3-methyl-5-hydroxy-6-metoxy-1,4-benzoquinol methylase
VAPVDARAASPLSDLLRCPLCHSALTKSQTDLVCTAVEHPHHFPFVDGLPVLTDAAAVEHDRHYELQRAYFDAEFARLHEYVLEPWRVSYLDRLRNASVLGTPGTLIVDVGVGGTGYTVIEHARLGGLAVGCDLSLEALRRARRFAEIEGVEERILWACCSAERLPLRSEAFDAVLAVAVFEHLPDDAAAMREAARVLRPGGRLWVTTPHALANIAPWFRPPNRVHDRRLGHLRRYESSDLANAARPLGLTVVDVQFTGHPIKVLQIAAGPIARTRPGRRLWWWCEARDLRRDRVRKGSMQVSVVMQRDR